MIVDVPRLRLPCGVAPAVLAAAVAVSTACGSGSGSGGSASAATSPPGPGVIFSYPADGQWDVPLRARLLLGFSKALPATVDGACSRANGKVTGAFCVEGPDGFVQGSLTIDGATLVFLPTGGLAPGATYRVWARPALVPGATNLPTDTPLLTFHARSTRTRAGAPATVLTVNGAPLAADGSSPQPFYDVGSVRLLFSEPLDRTTVAPGTVRLVHAPSGAAVDGVVVADGIHLTFDPAEALSAGERYRLEVDAAVRDAGGEAIAPFSVTLTPRRAAAPGKRLYPLPMRVAPPWTSGKPQLPSRIAGMPLNTYVMSSVLDGNQTGGVLPGGFDALAGDPAAGPTFPVVIPRGERIDMTSRVIHTGGIVDTGVSTGTVHFTLITDGFGVMRRNPFRDADQHPDDAEAPTFLDLTIDAIISSDDPLGNVISTQTIMGIRVLGIATVDGDQLAVEQVSTIDYVVLGLESAPISMVLRMRTGAPPSVAPLGLPVLTASSPVDGARDVRPGDPIELDFSGPLEPAVREGAAITLLGGTTPVPVGLRFDGSTLTVVPSRRLDEGTSYTLGWSGLRSLAGETLASGAVSFTTAVNTASAPVPPILLALYPGAPCALTGATAASPGHCAGGRATDSGYLPFTLPANHDVRAYFSLPIDPASVTTGAACGQGSVRVERVNAARQCTGVVPGTVTKLDRELRFVPDAPWTPGAAYRLTLVAGPNATCDAGELCGKGRLPLNTDPLNGYARGAGGPDVVIDFTGAPATTAVFQPLATEVVTDTNANGYVDGNEAPNAGSRGANEIAGVEGLLFSSATMDGADCLPDRTGKQSCSYVTMATPSLIRGVVERCPVDPQGVSSVMPYPCLEVQTLPGVILQTSTSMTTVSAGGLLGTNSSPTGPGIIRVREVGAPILGYIFNEPGQRDPQYVLGEDTYVDAPDMVLQPGATHDLRSRPLHMTLKGPVTYGPDGKTRVALRSLGDTITTVNITYALLGIPVATGALHTRTPAGEQRVTLTELPKR